MKKAISITVDHDIILQLKEICKAENRKMSNLIETILKEWVDKQS